MDLPTEPLVGQNKFLSTADFEGVRTITRFDFGQRFYVANYLKKKIPQKYQLKIFNIGLKSIGLNEISGLRFMRRLPGP